MSFDFCRLIESNVSVDKDGQKLNQCRHYFNYWNFLLQVWCCKVYLGLSRLDRCYHLIITTITITSHYHTILWVLGITGLRVRMMFRTKVSEFSNLSYNSYGLCVPISGGPFYNLRLKCALSYHRILRAKILKIWSEIFIVEVVEDNLDPKLDLRMWKTYKLEIDQRGTLMRIWIADLRYRSPQNLD